MDSELAGISDSELERIRQKMLSMGMDATDLDNEIAARKLKRTTNIAAPAAVAFGALERGYNARRAQNEAYKSDYTSSPDYLATEQENRSIRADSGSLNAESRMTDTENKQTRYEGNREDRHTVFDFKRSEAAIEHKYKDRKLTSVENQARIKDYTALLEDRRKDVALTQSRLQADKARLAKYPEYLRKAADDKAKEDLRAEQNYYANEVMKGEQELSDKQSGVVELRDKISGDIGATSQPAPISPTTQPSEQVPPGTLDPRSAPMIVPDSGAAQSPILNSPQVATSQPAAVAKPVAIIPAMRTQVQKWKKEAEAGLPNAMRALDVLRQKKLAGDAESAALLAVIGE